MVHEAAFEHAELQRRPGLDCDIVQAAVIQDAVVPDDGPLGGQVVEIQAVVDQLALVQGELELVEDQGLFHILFQQFQLARGDVADAEMADLAGAVQFVEGFRHLLRVEEQVRPVQQQGVQVIRLQAAQDPVGAVQDIGFAPAELLPVEIQAALGLDIDVLPLQAGEGEGVAEAGFRLAAAVAGGVVKEVDALFRRGADHGRRLFHGQGGHAHAAEDDGRRVLRAVDDIDHFHGGFSLFLLRNENRSGRLFYRVKLVQTRGSSGAGVPISCLPRAMLFMRKTMLRARVRMTWRPSASASPSPGFQP